jgi:hypothetical protein
MHLLKYGPKTPSPIAKSLKTYRENVSDAQRSDSQGHGAPVIVSSYWR